MPPHLHPRSTATSTLFAGTLLASFVIVSIPHLFPCPRPHGLASYDTRASPAQRQRLAETEAEIEALTFRELEAEARLLEAQEAAQRECPVPKPGGLLGRVLGFEGRRKGETGVAETGKS